MGELGVVDRAATWNATENIRVRDCLVARALDNGGVNIPITLKLQPFTSHPKAHPQVLSDRGDSLKIAFEEPAVIVVHCVKGLAYLTQGRCRAYAHDLERVPEMVPCKGAADETEFVCQALLTLWRRTRGWSAQGRSTLRWARRAATRLCNVLVAGLLGATSSGETKSEIRYVGFFQGVLNYSGELAEVGAARSYPVACYCRTSWATRGCVGLGAVSGIHELEISVLDPETEFHGPIAGDSIVNPRVDHPPLEITAGPYPGGRCVRRIIEKGIGGIGW